MEPLDVGPVIEHLIALERHLMDPAIRRNRQAVGALLTPDFYEFGRSGVVWLHDALLDALDEDNEATMTGDGFQGHQLADGVVVLTYHGERSQLLTKQRSLRSSIWVRGDDGQWRMRFHQGTPAA